ncbi:MAG: Ferredoxin--NADP reductase [Gemmatimonadaceae bacterium]|nr:Ferredoxin--NADP reductase [Gemmatimonadaceae bacterium]
MARGARRENETPHPLVRDEPGHVELLLGNEAIARGAIEAGVGFACGYPGTPSSEVTDTLGRVAPALGFPFEYSINEKVAIEMAFAASLSGARSIVAMKHLGLMYAGDPLSTMPYVGTVAGMVIVSAGDPSLHTSPNEQDQRHLAEMLHIPMLDPRHPAEALEATRFAFELSERAHLPVILRPTTRVCHTAAPVTFGPIRRRAAPRFERSPQRLLPIPSNARRMRVEITERLRIARQMMDGSGLYLRKGGGTRGIIAMGAPAAICDELTDRFTDERRVTLASLATVFPLPEDWLVETLRGLETVLVVEELSPWLEDRLRALCSLHGLSTQVLGKRTGHFPMAFEYEPPLVRDVLATTLGIGDAPSPTRAAEPIAPRAPTLCAACPHRATFFAARSVFGPDALFFNDIGCYTLGVNPPLNAGEALLAMGAGFSLATGVAAITGQRTVGFVGDSTFFHSGIPALLNAIKGNANVVAVVMDNQVTAMTGFQESPGTAVDDGRLVPAASIEAIVTALGAKHIEIVDPNDLSATMCAFGRARDATGVSVIVARQVCPVFDTSVLVPIRSRKTPRPADRIVSYRIDQQRCRHCGREGCGQRCSQGVTLEYERAIARARSLERGHEAQRDPVAPCTQRCPLYLCIQGYAAHIAAGRYADALELITDGLPLPDSVCRVCHRPCEDVCVRAGIDEPVAINDLKRFVMDWAAQQETYPRQPTPEAAHGRTIAVVGAGPAGLAAAQSLAMRGYAVNLFDAAEKPGGLLRFGIPEYRLPSAVLDRDIARIMHLGVRFRGGQRLGDNLELADLLSAHDAVVLAAGAGDDVLLEFDGDGPMLTSGLRFLATDALAAPNVIVIGGGNTAVDAARTARRRGAERAVIVCLEDRDTMPAIASEIEAAQEEGVEILSAHRAVRLTPAGADVERVLCRRPGSRDPADYTSAGDAESGLTAQLVIVAVGQSRQPLAFGLGTGRTYGAAPDFSGIDPETGATEHPRVFAAGDLASGASYVTEAIASGLRAAWGLDTALRGRGAADRRLPPPRASRETPCGRSGVTRPDRDGRHRPPELEPRSRVNGFEEVTGTLSEADARREAMRCMICGHCGNCNACLDLFGCPAFFVADGRIEIDSQLCTACGVCAQFCPNGAIVPVYDRGLAVTSTAGA